MSDRRYDSDRGSSRSARDDSRRHREKRRSRSRSRSPRRADHSDRYNRSRERSYDEDKNRRNRSREREGHIPSPPPPPRITKISIGFSKPQAPIKMSLSSTKSAGPTASKPAVASIFAADDDEEPEQMPAEARMRMRNIGRETPTSAGPNSFGKTKHGFCDAKKVFEKNLKEAMDDRVRRPSSSKLPQTIYKLNGDDYK